jgi:L-ascorbate metabolism protein UlaG (beta-lactamase superfamily)
MDESIDWLGHATVRIELDGIRILTDPTIRERIGPLDRKVAPIPHREVEAIDVVLISHLHLDHLDLASLRRLGDARIIVPAGAGSILRAAGHRDVDEFAPGEQTSHGSLTIDIVRAEHSGFRPPFGPTAPALGFVVSNGRRRIYFAGDTAIHSGMSEIPDLDVALVPVWGWGPNLSRGHMDPRMAADALTLLRPRIAVPIHWGTFWPKALDRVRPDRLRLPGSEFQAAAAEIAPRVHTEVLAPGERLSRLG